MILFFDTETSGLPDFKTQAEKFEAHPHIVQLGAILYDDDRHVVAELNLITKPVGFTITKETSDIHGITQEKAEKYGLPFEDILKMFLALCDRASLIVAHNHSFDEKMIRISLHRRGTPADAEEFRARNSFCTMKAATPICQLPGKYGFKWPTLQEAHTHFIGKPFEGAHDAMADVRACAAVYFAMHPLPKSQEPAAV
jgi:DNA polymerase III epsilon subunit-like protein